MSGDYQDQFYAEQTEVVVLIEDDGGARKVDGVWAKVATTLAHIQPKTGKLSDKLFNIEWLPKNETERKHGLFDSKTIYRLKVGINPDDQHVCRLIEILEKDYPNELLQNYLVELDKPVEMEDDVLGKIVLDKMHDCFEGSVQWQGEKVFLTLDEIDVENKASWTRARNAAKELVSKQAEYDAQWKAFACQKLFPVVQKWHKDPKIAVENFEESLRLSELAVLPSGKYIAYYEGELLLGHAVEIQGSLKKGVAEADIVD